MRFLVPGLVLSAVSAQTFVVDANNGPGTNYTTIAAAVAAVPSGSTLLVRPGSYGAFSFTGKGLTILGEPGVDMQGTVAISGTQPTQQVTMRGISWSSSDVAPGSDYLMEITQCLGPVLVERTTAPQSLVAWQSSPGIFQETSTFKALSCNQLTLRGCVFSGTTAITDCHTSIESCSMIGDTIGYNPCTAFPCGRTQSGLAIGLGSAQISGNSLIQGGDGWWSLGLSNIYDAPGIQAGTIDLRIIDGDVRSGQANILFATAAIQVLSTAPIPIRIDPRVTLLPHGQIPAVTGPTQFVPMPQAMAASAVSPGAISATTESEVGDTVVLVVALPGPPTVVPGFADPFWMIPGTNIFAAIGTHTTAAPVSSTVTVPPGFAGVQIMWHAVAFGPVTGLQVSNPATSLIY